MSGRIRLKRAYEPPAADDGYRVLVDRVWPRGVTRESLRLDSWQRSVAPSDDLRRWFGHHAERWPEFRQRYLAELIHGESRPALDTLIDMVRDQSAVTLLFGARDPDHNQAVVLRDVLEAALAMGLPAARPDLPGAIADIQSADLGELERLTRERLGLAAALHVPADVALVASLPAYVDARISGLCHEGALEIYDDALRGLVGS